jgi:hypothetical protein
MKLPYSLKSYLAQAVAVAVAVKVVQQVAAMLARRRSGTVQARP